MKEKDTLGEFLQFWDWEEMSYTIDELKRLAKVLDCAEKQGIVDMGGYNTSIAVKFISQLSKEAHKRGLWNDPKIKSKKKTKQKRVSRQDPKDNEPCCWCKKVKRTTLNEIWSKADPKGEVMRLCDDCLSICAGG